MASFVPPAPHTAEVLGRPSRKAATVALETHLEVLGGRALRLALSEALKKAPSLGGQERRFAALAARELSRHQRLLDLVAKHAGHAPSRWALREDLVLVRYSLWRRLFTNVGWDRIRNEVQLPGPLRPRSVKDPLLEAVVSTPLDDLEIGGTPLDRAATWHSFPSWLAQRIDEALAPEPLDEVLAALNREPVIQLRVRPPLSAEAARQKLAEEGIQTEVVSEDPPALAVTGAGHRIFDSPLFKAQALQQQDFGSQLLVALCRPARGQAAARVIDYCAGAGGKTLALGDQVGEAGRVEASDLSRRRLNEARKRVSSARLRNVTFPHPVNLAAADVVLVDAPCSGTGALAREPDQKWKLDAKAVSGFAKEQRQILEEIAPALRVGALLVYGTCSLLPEENEDVVSAFLAQHPEYERRPVEEVLSPAVAQRHSKDGNLRVLPHQSVGGAFFGARLVRT